MAVPGALIAFLEEAGIANRRPELHTLFIQQRADLNTTMTLHTQSMEHIHPYISAYIARYLAEIPDRLGKWVPEDLIKHIYKGDRPFRQRLARFAGMAESAGQYVWLASTCGLMMLLCMPWVWGTSATTSSPSTPLFSFWCMRPLQLQNWSFPLANWGCTAR